MIELTDEVENLLSCLCNKIKTEILRRAWDVCCDGQALASYGITVDLWDGSHDDLRRETEANIVQDIIDSDYMPTDRASLHEIFESEIKKAKKLGYDASADINRIADDYKKHSEAEAAVKEFFDSIDWERS